MVSISYHFTILYEVSYRLVASITLDSVSKINKGYFPNDEELFTLFNDYDGIKN
ncbi:hypothetical protein [Clostridium sporogenes]|uniref:hypothetical protein n=1 Tax=Clostridium sporogenes TaxID=1509 RepID=UPI003DA4D83D